LSVEESYAFTPGQKVSAKVKLIEGDVEHRPHAKPCEDGWCHALPGDEGVVLSEEEAGVMVRFHLTGTAMLCFDGEIEPSTT
jgi:hypothetical protein